MSILMPETTTATELQRNYKQVVKRAKRTKQPVVVLSNNKPEVIMLDYVTFTSKYSQPFRLKKRKGALEEVFGSWTKEEADEFDRIIEDAFEKVDQEKWK